MRVITVTQSSGELHLRHSEGICSGHVLQETGLIILTLHMPLTHHLALGGAVKHVQDYGGNSLQGSRVGDTSGSQRVNVPNCQPNVN